MVKTKEKAVPFQEILSSWTIRKKMLLLFACVFVPALALALLEGMDERRDIIAKAEQQMMMVAESLAAQQEQITAATRQLLGTLAQLPEVQYRDIKACNVLFRRLNQQNLQYTNISLATPDGNMVASSLPFTPGSVNLSDRRHIREAIRTLDFSVGEYIMGRVSKVSSINFTHPVIDKNGKLVAIIIAGFNLNEYERYIPGVCKCPDKTVEPDTVQSRHEHIRDYQVDLLPFQGFPGLGPVGRYDFRSAAGRGFSAGRGAGGRVEHRPPPQGVRRMQAQKLHQHGPTDGLMTLRVKRPVIDEGISGVGPDHVRAVPGFGLPFRSAAGKQRVAKRAQSGRRDASAKQAAEGQPGAAGLALAAIGFAYYKSLELSYLASSAHTSASEAHAIGFDYASRAHRSNLSYV